MVQNKFYPQKIQMVIFICWGEGQPMYGKFHMFYVFFLLKASLNNISEVYITFNIWSRLFMLYAICDTQGWRRVKWHGNVLDFSLYKRQRNQKTSMSNDELKLYCKILL